MRIVIDTWRPDLMGTYYRRECKGHRERCFPFYEKGRNVSKHILVVMRADPYALLTSTGSQPSLRDESSDLGYRYIIDIDDDDVGVLFKLKYL